VLAALSRQIESAPQSFVEALVGDALNIHDVMEWAERSGHHLLTQRQDPDGTVRLLIQPGRAQALV